MYGENTKTIAIPIYRVLPYPVIIECDNYIIGIPGVQDLVQREEWYIRTTVFSDVHSITGQ